MTSHFLDTSNELIISRPVQNDQDFWAVRKLLIDTAPITPPGFNWEIRRWEGKRFYSNETAFDPAWQKTCRVWQTEDGQIIGAVHPEGSGDAYLQIHPDYRHIEAEMLIWAEANLSTPTDDGRRQLRLFVFEYDTQRKRLLADRGFEKTPHGGMIRRLRFGRQQIPTPKLAEGYTLRTTNPDNIEDCQRIADILNAAFNRDFHTAVEYQNFTRLAPSFRRDLDLAAVAPDGVFAAYTGIPYDEANKRGIFEPVCTHPDHQRRGLAKALMLDGLHRLRAIGADDVLVGTGDMIPANRLYDSMGFTEAYKEFMWQKVF